MSTPAILGLAIDPDPLFADLIGAVGAAAEELGIEWRDVRTARDAAAVDRLIMVGRPGRYRDLVADLAAVPRTVWVGEPLPPLSAVEGRGVAGRGITRSLRALGGLGRR